MAIVTISRGSYSMGEMVAEKVAEKLGFRLISRDLLFATGDRFHIPEKKLEQAIHDAPGIFNQHLHTKEIFLAYIRATLLEMVAEGNVVYHGLAGHLLLQQLDNVFKVRLTASLEHRIQRKLAEGLSHQQAKAKILEDDKQRLRWTKAIYHAEPNDASFYDLVVRVGKFSVADAVELICEGAKKDSFITTPESIRQARDLLLACNLKANLVEHFPKAHVSCEYGNLLVIAPDKDSHSSKFKQTIELFKKENEGIHNLEVHSGVKIPEDAV